jgi:hypothetical protein
VRDHENTKYARLEDPYRLDLMNVTELLDKIPLWGIFLSSLMITFLSTELGFRLGKMRRERLTQKEKVNTGPLVAASLSLFAFMLAMVFGAAASRFIETKDVALDEAIAIGTAYVRADLLPEVDRVDVRQLLQDYVTLRIDAVQNRTEQELEQTIRRSKEM